LTVEEKDTPQARPIISNILDPKSDRHHHSWQLLAEAHILAEAQQAG
jgi:hypothetical protein